MLSEKKNINVEAGLHNIRNKIDILKNRLNNIEEKINIQEKIINFLDEGSKTMAKTLALPETVYLPTQEQIMMKAFSKGKIPRILSK